MKKEKNEYDSIKVLKGLEGLRKNIGMYLGNPENGDALHHLIWEILDNSIDEYMNSFGNKIIITIHKDESLSCEDFGRGIPVSYNKEEKKSSLELALSTIHAGNKSIRGGGYMYSGGLHGVGACATTACSAQLKAIVWRDGKEYSMIFKQGKKVQDLEEKPARGNKTGTLIRFSPDLQIFKNIVTFDPEIIRTRLRELSFLCYGLTIEFIDEKNNTKDVFPGESNITDFIKYLANNKELIGPPILLSGNFKNIDDNNAQDIIVEVALGWLDNADEEEICKCYTNNIHNVDGGTHLVGFKSALTRTINNYINQADIPKNLKIDLTGDAIREGLISIVSIRHPDPKFSSQTKVKLVVDSARNAVESIVPHQLITYLDKNAIIAKKIITRCVNAQKALLAARRAREAIRKTAIDSSGICLPGKLADCSDKNPDNCELYLVEGQSAGGCFSGDTKVSLADGRGVDFKTLIEENNAGKQNYCYTISNGDIALALIKNPRLSKNNVKVIEIVLDNGEKIVCTPEHKLMLINEEYVEAKDSVNKNLMPHHKVIKITKLEKEIDVYDLEVPETHNFALSSGIFVHNSAKQGRNREFQAILPLRGKVLNVERCEYKRMMANEELTNLITALGVGIGKNFNIEKLRYGKVIIMTDSDVDGSHIRALLLTFFFRQMPQLILNGNIYVAQPPLYRINYRGNSYYFKDDKAVDKFKEERKIYLKDDKISTKLKSSRTLVAMSKQRFKGLGEMNPEQLWETTLNPENRTLLQVTIKDYLETDKIFSILMGDQVDVRKDFIMNSCEYAKLDI